MADSLFSSGHGLSGEKTVTTAGTAEALADTAPTLYKSLVIRAKVSNTGQVYVGGSDVASTTNDGLDPGDSLPMFSDRGLDLSDIFIDVDTNGEGVDIYAVQ